MSTMTGISDILKELAAEPSRRLSASETALLSGAMSAYPWFTLAAPVLLSRADGLDAAMIGNLRRRVALDSAGRRSSVLAVMGADWTDFYPDADVAEPMGTDDAIDTFLRTYGSQSAEDDALLERLILNPAPDYGEMLAREEQMNMPPDSSPEADPDSQEERINAFIRVNHPAAPRAEEPQAEPLPEHVHVAQPEPADDSLLSESLAKIFIRQGRYERAYEIISSLNLKFPKKSAYFADQLRFLRKLMLNRRCLDSASGCAKD